MEVGTNDVATKENLGSLEKFIDRDRGQIGESTGEAHVCQLDAGGPSLVHAMWVCIWAF